MIAMVAASRHPIRIDGFKNLLFMVFLLEVGGLLSSLYKANARERRKAIQTNVKTSAGFFAKLLHRFQACWLTIFVGNIVTSTASERTI
jgi:hypothetical protein